MFWVLYYGIKSKKRIKNLKKIPETAIGGFGYLSV